MAYLRVKWVKGYPYLYEQESYREGGRVRTRHICYLPRYRWTGTIGGVGFTPPSDLHPASKAYVDNEITKLEYCDKYPYERDILKHYLYFQNYIISVQETDEVIGRFHKGGGVAVGRPLFSLRHTVYMMKIFQYSDRFVWMHELGHSLEYEDELLEDDAELTARRWFFACEFREDFERTRSLDGKEQFIKKWGDLLDLRKILSGNKDYARKHYFLNRVCELKQGKDVRLEGGEILSHEKDLEHFEKDFKNWVDIEYRGKPSEIFADSVASLIINPKIAFESHGEVGRKYLSKLWTTLVSYFEQEYLVSLSRPRR